MHMRADMGSCERVVMGFDSQAVSAWVTKHFVTIFSKHVIMIFNLGLSNFEKQ